MTTDTTGAGKSKPSGGLAQRVISAVILAPVVLGILWYGSWPFLVFMLLSTCIAVKEWFGMTYHGGAAGKPCHAPAASIASVIASLGVIALATGQGAGAGLILIAALSLPFGLWLRTRKACVHPGRSIFGVLYIGAAMTLMTWLRGDDAAGLYALALVLLTVWGSDSFAYVAGRLIGGPKLAPKISPKKTWAGFVGSSAGAAVVAAAFACPQMMALAGVESAPGGLGYIGLAALGAVMGAVGQAGDLFISMLKRSYGVKDTGNLIPGHGGILDRVDALILVVILYAPLLALLGHGG